MMHIIGLAANGQLGTAVPTISGAETTPLQGSVCPTSHTRAHGLGRVYHVANDITNLLIYFYLVFCVDCLKFMLISIFLCELSEFYVDYLSFFILAFTFTFALALTFTLGCTLVNVWYGVGIHLVCLWFMFGSMLVICWFIISKCVVHSNLGHKK